MAAWTIALSSGIVLVASRYFEKDEKDKMPLLEENPQSSSMMAPQQQLPSPPQPQPQQQQPQLCPPTTLLIQKARSSQFLSQQGRGGISLDSHNNRKCRNDAQCWADAVRRAWNGSEQQQQQQQHRPTQEKQDGDKGEEESENYSMEVTLADYESEKHINDITSCNNNTELPEPITSEKLFESQASVPKKGQRFRLRRRRRRRGALEGTENHGTNDLMNPKGTIEKHQQRQEQQQQQQEQNDTTTTTHPPLHRGTSEQASTGNDTADTTTTESKMIETDTTTTLPRLPQFVFAHNSTNNHNDKNNGDDEHDGDDDDDDTGGCRLMRDIHGHCILHVLPARIDTRHGAALYTSALCHYLDELLVDSNNGNDMNNNNSNSNNNKITVLLDVRGGRGWPNPPALQMVGFIRHVAGELSVRYPNRLHQCLVFPLPRAATWIWSMAIKPFLRKELRQAVELIPGSGTGVDSPPPNPKLMSSFLLNPEGDVHHLEQHRLSWFGRPSS
ncbi:hypothetical protein ACA910_002629 [Epithemia clementina (nom. ined.)]